MNEPYESVTRAHPVGPNTLKTKNTLWIHFNSLFQNLFIC